MFFDAAFVGFSVAGIVVVWNLVLDPFRHMLQVSEETLDPDQDCFAVSRWTPDS